ncbi:glycosyltransferase family 4 protein [Winogradskyella sp. A3E31]|uniref:glycosyltransferase family 4 protein n=1 Tax=Winogradskyella sp. A3E31 TaxID=3349637 RepID=UPI00398B1689
MTNVLYIGNNLNSPQTNLSSIQTLGPLLESEGYTLRYSSGIRSKPLRLLAMLWAVVKNRSWANVVLIDTYSTLNFYYAMAVSQCCRVLGIPYICCLNGGNLPLRLASHPHKSRWIFKHAKVNVAPSFYLKQAFDKHGFKTVYIPNSIQMSHYPWQQRSYERIDLLWVRSFAKIYNPVLAIKVQHYLQEKGFKITLCMVGPDSDGTLLDAKDLADRLGTHTVFTGKLSKQAWIAQSQDYNIFINTTNFDNTPVSVMEAMALGLPVVSTNVGGMPYLIEDGTDGLLVAPDSVEAMAEGILRIVEDHALRKTLIKAARQKVEQFDWSKVKQLWHTLLN